MFAGTLFLDLLKMVKNCAISNKRLLLCIMLKNRLLSGLIFMISISAACKKPEVYNAEERFAIEGELIKKWSDSTGIVLTKDDSGIFYHIDTLGEGALIGLPDELHVSYDCKLLRDTLVDQVPEGSLYKFILNKGIPGWKAGLLLMKEGGQIRLVVPSPLAYRNAKVGSIPPNSPLDFKIRIRKVVKK